MGTKTGSGSKDTANDTGKSGWRLCFISTILLSGSSAGARAIFCTSGFQIVDAKLPEACAQA